MKPIYRKLLCVPFILFFMVSCLIIWLGIVITPLIMLCLLMYVIVDSGSLDEKILTSYAKGIFLLGKAWLYSWMTFTVGIGIYLIRKHLIKTKIKKEKKE